MQKKPKKSKKNEVKMPIATAVALYLGLEVECATVKQCAQQMLEWVRKQVGDPSLTLPKIEHSLYAWFEKGWAVLNDGYIWLERAGRHPINKIVEAATAPPQAQPA